MMSPAELNARGDELIRRGEARKREGMGMTSGRNMGRRGGENRLDVIRDGEDMIQKGQRLKAAAATRPS